MSDATSYVGDLKVFSADDADEEWVIAKSAADAAAVWQEIAGAPLDFGDGQVAWVEEKTKRELMYDEQISPLMKQIIAIAKANDIPMFATFDLDDDRRDAGRLGLHCTTLLLPEDSSDKMKGMHRIQYPQPEIVFAIWSHQ